ncbi:MAG: hypothetical protein HYZ13_03100 [Acidobacteria bacterium]|nr:hypothetical protein [Acidobacteriota bacterium]
MSATDVAQEIESDKTRYYGIWPDIKDPISELPLVISTPSADAHEDLLAWVSTFVSTIPQFTNICAVEPHDVTLEWIHLDQKELKPAEFRIGLGLIFSELLISTQSRNSQFSPSLRQAQRTLAYTILRGYTVGYSKQKITYALNALETVKVSSNLPLPPIQTFLQDLLNAFHDLLPQRSTDHKINNPIKDLIEASTRFEDLLLFLSKVSNLEYDELREIIDRSTAGTKEQRLRSLEDLVRNTGFRSYGSEDLSPIFGYLYASLAKGNFAFLEQIGIRKIEEAKTAIWFILFTAIDPNNKIETTFNSLGLSLLMNIREHTPFPYRGSLELSLIEFLIKTQRLKITTTESIRFSQWGYRLALLPGISIPLRILDDNQERPFQSQSTSNENDRLEELQNALSQINSIASKFKRVNKGISEQPALFDEKTSTKRTRTKHLKRDI